MGKFIRSFRAKSMGCIIISLLGLDKTSTVNVQRYQKIFRIDKSKVTYIYARAFPNTTKQSI